MRTKIGPFVIITRSEWDYLVNQEFDHSKDYPTDSKEYAELIMLEVIARKMFGQPKLKVSDSDGIKEASQVTKEYIIGRHEN